MPVLVTSVVLWRAKKGLILRTASCHTGTTVASTNLWVTRPWPLKHCLCHELIGYRKHIKLHVLTYPSLRHPSCVEERSLVECNCLSWIFSCFRGNSFSFTLGTCLRNIFQLLQLFCNWFLPLRQLLLKITSTGDTPLLFLKGTHFYWLLSEISSFRLC